MAYNTYNCSKLAGIQNVIGDWTKNLRLDSDSNIMLT